MSRLYIMCGMPASGKSTFARKLVDNNNNICYVSRDEIRFSIIKNDEDYFSHEKEVFKKFVITIAENLKAEHDVIADATHLNRFSRNKLIRAIDQYITNYTIEYVVLMTPLEICMERNAAREGRARVPDSIMKSMAKNFEYITNEEKNLERVRVIYYV